MRARNPAYPLRPASSRTNGKIERFHETLNARMNPLVHTRPDELRRTVQDFIEDYNYRRYHEAIGNSTPAMCTANGGDKSYAGGRTKTTHDRAAAAQQSGPLEPTKLTSKLSLQV